MEQRFGDGRAYLTGKDFTIADACAFSLLNWLQFVGIDLSRWPRLSAYVRRVAARPAGEAAAAAFAWARTRAA
ncbi:MAG: glutathione S-transferase C-terminal domain-containing protein [Caulobacteraceae bacterium]